MPRRGHGEGEIEARSRGRYRLRWRKDGKRHSQAFHGTLSDARKELRRLLEAEKPPTKGLRLADWLRDWLKNDPNISPKTRERYQQLVERQIVPRLGRISLEKLAPARLLQWHGELLRDGRAGGGPLSARTVGHAHRVLSRALAQAISMELLSRNVAAMVRPPRIPVSEMPILTQESIAQALDRLSGHTLRPIVALALSTGLRRGELCALQWADVRLNTVPATLTVGRSMEETQAGLRLKPPKSIYGRRTLTLPASVVELLTSLRRESLVGCTWVFPEPGTINPYPPDKLSRDWGNVCRDRKLPRIPFHALRHTHASALIAAGVDVVMVSRRLGHASPAITLAIYAHLFTRTDQVAAEAWERQFGPSLAPGA